MNVFIRFIHSVQFANSFIGLFVLCVCFFVPFVFIRSFIQSFILRIYSLFFIHLLMHHPRNIYLLIQQ